METHSNMCIKLNEDISSTPLLKVARNCFVVNNIQIDKASLVENLVIFR